MVSAQIGAAIDARILLQALRRARLVEMLETARHRPGIQQLRHR